MQCSMLQLVVAARIDFAVHSDSGSQADQAVLPLGVLGAGLSVAALATELWKRRRRKA